MVRILAFFIMFGATSFLLGQSGYLGSKNSFDLEISASPSFKKSYRLNNNFTEASISNRFIYESYSVSYSRVLSKKHEISVRYRFTNAHAQMTGSYYAWNDTIYTLSEPEYVVEKRLNFLHDPQMRIHGFSLEFKRFVFGSAAPLGKYLGFGFEYSLTSFDQSEDIHIGKRELAHKTNMFLSKHSLMEYYTVNPPNTINASSVILHAIIGRTYPVSDFMLISVGIRYPILSLISAAGSTNAAFGITNDPFKFSSESSFNHIVRSTLKRYSRMSLNLGVKFTF